MNANPKMALLARNYLLFMLLLGLTSDQIIIWTHATYKIQTFSDIC